MTNPPRINVLGVGISTLTLDSAVESVVQSLAEGRQGYVTVTGVHGVSECQSDSELRRIHNESMLTTPDGMPLTWMGRLQGVSRQQMDRVYGPDLMLRIFERGEKEGLRHYFFGGNDGVAELLKEKLTERFPKAQIVGTHTPPFRPLTEDEEIQLVEELNRLQPHCLWVGLSTPKQERFMAGFLQRYGSTTLQSPRLAAPLVMFGVGAAFDFHAGLVPQAPAWMQRAGLEWFFRLLKEPRRLWRRYLKNNPLFLARVALQLTGLRKYELPIELPAQAEGLQPVGFEAGE
ncbi:MAG: WecB/TagA/CpsF family glycosyltransferase [Planctomycetes bacterium]|nr:WecB/TagA/CpsF family glycosyltransferase [Planctomycetota bacterium]